MRMNSTPAALHQEIENNYIMVVTHLRPSWQEFGTRHAKDASQVVGNMSICHPASRKETPHEDPTDDGPV